ncbi:MAG: hypothetical protein GX610_23000 [Rhodococcus sp.]|nr:hypothetical protein [Rhodococcus sp. (in: high G+C Gram-positive bacteria)]
MSEFGISVLSLCVAGVAALIALGALRYARRQTRAAEASATAAARSAELAEVVEKGRHFGWAIALGVRADTSYQIRNTGTVDAHDVQLGGDFLEIGFGDRENVTVAAGQAVLFSALTGGGHRGGEVRISWIPAAGSQAGERLTWTEILPDRVTSWDRFQERQRDRTR